METNAITREIIGAAIRVHTELGPGLLESAYRACLCHDLRLHGLRVEAEVPIPIKYLGLKIDVGYRTDLIVEDQVIVELKAVTRVTPVHRAQFLTCVRLSKR